MITFLNPLLLGGLAAVAIPIVLHLLHRKRSREIWFPSLMFLLKIDARTMRRKRLREIILLAARCLLLLLLALAAAQPVLASRPAAGGNTAMVLVLDTSLSMTYRQENVTRIKRAQETALRAIDSLMEKDRVAVLTSGNTLTVDLSGDHSLARSRVLAVEATSGAERLRDVVEQAIAMLGDVPERNREIVLLTDLQKRAVAALEGLALPGEIHLYVADHGDDVSANLTLVDVSSGESNAVLGQPVALSATVANNGSAAAASRVSLYRGDERVGVRTVSLAAGEKGTIGFDVTPEQAGSLTGRVVLDGDALPGDDTRFFVVPVLDRVEILVVNGDPSSTPWLDETIFLRAALDPAGLGAVEIVTPFHLTVVPPEDLGTRDLMAFRAVILANVGTLASRPALDLATFVRRGGGVIVFAGNRIEPEECLRIFGPGGPAEGLLPRMPSGPMAIRTDEGPLPRIDRMDLTHPIFEKMDESFRADLTHIRCTQALDLSGEDGRVLIEFENGRPLLVEGELGAGRVLQFAVTADADWTNLPKRPLFVALLHKGLFHLMRGSAARESRTVGDAISLPDVTGLGPGGSIEVYAPEREDDPARFTDADRGVTGFTETARPGFYRVVTRSGEGVTETAVAVNVDPAEGALARSSIDALAEILDTNDVTALDVESDVKNDLRRARTGRPIWGVLLILALILLLAEALLANLWTKPPASIPDASGDEASDRDSSRPRDPVLSGAER
jgi:Aerotolerance regulator N-terminal/von Willebrand factor type A domain/CARDB